MDRPSRLALALLCLACVMDANRVRAAGPPSSRALHVGDSAFACPPGDASALFLQLFRLTPSASTALFPKGDSRRLPLKGVFGAPELNRRLGHLAKSPIQTGAAQFAAFKGSFRVTLLSSRGDGFALFAVTKPPFARIHVCSMRDSLPHGVSVRERIRMKDTFLLVPLVLDGIPHALAVRLACLPDEKLMKEQMAFVRAAGAPDRATFLAPAAATREALECLQVPLRDIAQPAE